MTVLVVLDAAGIDELASGRSSVRALVRRQTERAGDTVCAAVTLAEVCRGPERTRRVEAALGRARGARPLRVVPTDVRLAKLVGYILFHSGSGSADLADAHVVGLCAGSEVALVLTSDPDDIRRLGDTLPGVRILTRDPALPL